MSHYSVLVVTKTDRISELEKLLAPFDESLEVAPYIYKTKEELDELDWITSEDDIFDEHGNLLTTYNPNSKWDWYSIGGRWSGGLHVVDDKLIHDCNSLPIRLWDIEDDFCTYAVLLPDGSWYSPGEMGWWGMSSESEDEWNSWADGYVDAMKELKRLWPNWFVTLVDCHIQEVEMVYIATIDWYYNEDECPRLGMFLIADSYVDATEKLVRLYGENEILNYSLECFAPDDGLEFNLSNENQARLFGEVRKALEPDIIF